MTQSDHMKEALDRIARLGVEWSANRLGSRHIQRKRWERMQAIAEQALCGQPLGPEPGPPQLRASTPSITQQPTMAIGLSRGMVALVDAADYDFLMQWTWYVCSDRKTIYAIRCERIAPRKFKYFAMHRVLLNPPPGMEIDHIDGNTLNNTRANLRLATRSQNAANRRVRSDNISGFKGVTFLKANRKWRAKIFLNRKTKYLGLFDTAAEASAAYMKAATEQYGEFARAK